MAIGKQVGRLSILVIPDTSKFREKLKLLIKSVENSYAVNLKVEAEVDKARLAIEKFRQEESAKQLNLHVGVNSLAASAQLRYVSRDRFTTLHVRLDKRSLLAAGTALAALSGARLARDVLEEVNDALKRIDLSVPKIARVSLAIAGLSAMTLAASVGLVTLTGDLAKMGNTAFVLPAMIAGMTTGIITLVMALKDSKKQLAVLAPAMHELQDSMSAKFWAEAKDPIIEFVTAVLPQARKGFNDTATALGNQAAAIADAFKETFGNGVLAAMFDRLRETIDIVTTGAQGFAEALTTLGTVGSNYLPRLAEWVVKIGEQFNTWLQAVAASGELDAFIEDGITQLKLFGESIADIVRIFKGIDRAATAAGAQGLTTFAAKMKGAAEIVNGEVFQTALTTILGGANRALDGLGEGMERFGGMLAALAPEISTVLGVAGETLGNFLGNISDALDQPAFKNGLVDLFTGIQSGVDALGPAMDPLFAFLGQLGTTVGTLAASFGPLLAAIKITFAPLLEEILAAVTPLIPMLSGALTNAIKSLGPVVEGITKFLKDNQGVVVALLAIWAGWKAVGVIMAAFNVVIGIVKGAQLGFAAASYGAAAASYAQGAAGKAGIIVGYATAAVQAIVSGALYRNIVAWVANTYAVAANKGGMVAHALYAAANFVIGLQKTVAGLAVQTGAWFTNTGAIIANKAQMVAHAAIQAKNVVVGIAKSAVGIGVQTAAWVANTAAQIANKVAIEAAFWKTVVVGLASSAAGVVVQTGAWIANTAAQVAAKAVVLAGAVAMGIATAAQWAMNVAMSANPIALIVIAIAALVAGLVYFFTQTEVGKEAWANFTQFLGEAWENIVAFVQDAIANVVSFVTDHWGLLLSLLIGPLGLVIQWIVENWSGIVQFFSEVWTNIVAFVTTAINVILAVITAIGAGIAAVWGAIWNGIVAAVMFVWTAIVASVTFYINLVVAVITAIGATIAAIWNGIWTGIGKFLSDTWNRIVAYIAFAIALVQAKISITLAIIKAVWDHIWETLGAAVSKAWEAIKGVVTGMIDGIKATIGKIGGFIGGIKDKVLDAVSNAGTWLKDAGKKIIQGLIDGIDGMIQKVKDVAGKVMGAIADFFPHSPAKEGPFSGKGWTLYSGQALGDGLAEGMDSRVARVRTSALSMMGAASGTARVSLDAAADALSARGVGVAGGGDYINVMGNVGYDPAAIAAEINLKKKQAAMMNGLSRVGVA